MTAMQKADIAIVGGGIIGLATAYELSERYPDHEVVVFEKEQHVAHHQSGRNSGVLHSGIYYRPGSLKAKNCRLGKEAMQLFCEQEEIPYEICGKVIVAVSDEEVGRLENIFQRGQQNGVRCRLIGPDELHELEPHAAGVQAIHVPEAGIADYRRVCERLREIVEQRGGTVHCGTLVRGINHPSANEVVVETTRGEWHVQHVVNCGGLYSDRLAKMAGQDPAAKVVPFRGEFYELKPEARHLCRNLIYPVPDPSFPFLGVHFTRMTDGRIECGPNAVLAFAREGYGKFDISPRDLLESLTYAGFLRLAAKHWKVGAGEMWRSFSKQAFVAALQRLMPEIRGEQLVAARAGVRAQAVTADGSLVDDFLIQREGRIVNVENAPSPAATSSLNVARTVVDELEAGFG